MRDAYSLFETVCSKGTSEEYGQWEVKRAAKPYIDYLKEVQEWHMDRSVSWKVRRPGEGRGRGAGGRPNAPSGQRRQKGTPISLEGVDDADLRRIVDAARTLGHVYEYDPDDGPRVSRDDMIGVTGIDEDELLIWLERSPTKPCLKAERSTYQEAMAVRAMEEMLYRPSRAHMPLRRLFRRKSGAAWPRFKGRRVDRWFFLSGDVDGADEQRRFVRIALGTPDFAFLEGPPGSGKTAVLCELAVQMAVRGKRVLFCASTNVAVDNLIERMVEKGGDVMRHVAPVRIGRSDKVSEAASRYEYGRFARTVGEKMHAAISGRKSRSGAQEAMLKVLEGGDEEALGGMVRDHANLVCGTTIGMLSHPDIRNRTLRRFDMMILDEASKTTLQEFLVPAVHADRWIIAGDTRQLVPYTDSADMAVHVGACIEPEEGEACLDAFMAKKRGQTTVLVGIGPAAEAAYRAQCERLGVKIQRGSAGGIERGEVVIWGGAAGDAPKRPGVVLRGAAGDAADPRRGRGGGGERTWSEEVAWRIGIHWHGMQGAKGGRGEGLGEEIDMLMPARDGGDEVRQQVDRVRRIAVPSVLEVIQDGFPGGHVDGDTLLEHGMPCDDFGRRHALLEWQHRMHPDIAAFSHRHVYGGLALRTPDGMAERRAWIYGRYSHRAVWIDVRGRGSDGAGSVSNEDEARLMAGEVGAFAEFAKKNRRPGGGPWEVAVLPFYAGQLRLLQRHMRRLAQGGGPHTFRIPPERPCVLVGLHTVDSFQGHEADFVLIGLTNSHPTLFLGNPNRLNVALTRARYQCAIFGDRAAMSREPLLADLVRETRHWKGVA